MIFWYNRSTYLVKCILQWLLKTSRHRRTKVNSVTRSGYIWKFFGNKFTCKSSPNTWWLFGLFWKYLLLGGELYLANFGHFLVQHMATLNMNQMTAAYKTAAFCNAIWLRQITERFILIFLACLHHQFNVEVLLHEFRIVYNI